MTSGPGQEKEEKAKTHFGRSKGPGGEEKGEKETAGRTFANLVYEK